MSDGRTRLTYSKVFDRFCNLAHNPGHDSGKAWWNVRMLFCGGLLALIPSMVLAAPLTLNFTGSTGAGKVYGSFTYETVQGPSAVNVRNLRGNVVYTMTSWNITAESNVENLPTTTFTPSTSTLEFCQGRCIFGTGTEWFTTLTFSTSQTRLLLSFNLPNTNRLTNPPASLTEWGPFNLQASHYRALPMVPLAAAISGSLSSVPSLPETAN